MVGDPIRFILFSGDKREMRTISQRKRTADDDILSVHRLPNAHVTSDRVTIPERPSGPIVVWGKRRSVGRSDAASTGSCLKWPLSSAKRCHNCAHHFEGVPVPLPMSRDELRQVYFCEGNFCSWQCAKSFNMRETSPAGRGNRNMYIAVLAYKTWFKLRTQGRSTPTSLDKMRTYCNYRLDPAPPRSKLVEFGGDMTIEEYRKDFCGIVPPAKKIEETSSLLNIRQMNVLPFVDTTTAGPSLGAASSTSTDRKRETAGCFLGTRRLETNHVQEFNNSFVKKLREAKMDPDIMRRKKEMNVANTLLSTMGIEIKERLR